MRSMFGNRSGLATPVHPRRRPACALDPQGQETEGAASPTAAACAYNESVRLPGELTQGSPSKVRRLG
ncbi:Uncharacterised protein [uncultured archaeon]|nr:Uncharacterised protein [uncultured archaeon]